MSNQVRAAFREQAGWCDRMDSPLTALLCRLLAERLDDATAVGRRILGWGEGAGVAGEALPLRVVGALHGLVLSGRSPSLAAFYPPRSDLDPDRLWAAISDALAREPAHFDSYLRSVPQTNEVARCGVLIAGLWTVAARFGLPLDLYEIGSSAGLNLLPDRYFYRFARHEWGDPASPVRINPDWRGAAPPLPKLAVRRRRGVDLNPIDLSDESQRNRMFSYIWPDQVERLERARAAVALWKCERPGIDQAEAADWVERVIRPDGDAGGVCLLYHSITWQYLPAASQQRIVDHMERTGQRRRASAPLAWLRYEIDVDAGTPLLKLKTWPDGADRVLARGHPHAAWVEWFAAV